MSSAGHIALRGVRVHNLKSIDLDIPHRKLIVLCGLSGSGKSSLALDTLYAEGQRRYIESFSAYTRQFLQRLEKPEAERIDGIPPAIAVTSKNTSRSSRSTVGTATETSDYLRLLFAKIGHVFCLQVRPARCAATAPQSAAETSGRPAAGHALHDRLPLRVAGSRRQLEQLAGRIARRRLCAGDRRRAVGESGCDGGSWQSQRPSPPAPVAKGRAEFDAASPCPSPLAPRPHLRRRRSARGRQRQRQPAARFAGNGLHQGARAVLCVRGRGDEQLLSERSMAPSRRHRHLPEARAVRIPRPSPLAPRPCPHRRPAVAADGLQHAIGLRGLRHRVSAAGAAAVQFQQSAGGVSRVRRFWQRHRHRHGPGRARPEQVAPRRGDCAVEHAGLRPRVEGVAGAGRATTTCRWTCRSASLTERQSGLDPARRAGAEVRRAGGLLRLAGAAEVQDAHPRVPQPLAELPALSGLRRHAAAARGPGRADRRQEHRRDLRHEGPRRRRLLPQPANCPTGSGRSAA